MSFDIELSTKHPLDEIKDIIQSINKDSFDIFSDPNIILLLPDNISINNVKELITKEHGPKYLQEIEFSTFEKFAKSLINETGKPSEILPTDILRLLIFESIMEMSKKGNHLAAYFMNIIMGSNSLENHEVIKNMAQEFDDFLRTVHPPELSKEKKCFLKMLEISNNLEEDFHKKNISEALDFYLELENIISQKMAELGLNYGFISRSHLVGYSSEILKSEEGKKILNKIIPSLSKVWISAISVYDVSILEFINALLSMGLKIRINLGSMSAERLAARLKNSWNIKIIEIKKDPIMINIEHLGELPDIRRESEHIVLETTKLLTEGHIKEEEIIVSSRDMGVYEPYFESILSEYGLVGHFQTRKNLSLTPAFRLVSATLNLLSAIEQNIYIKPNLITDPLRLGFTTRYGEKPLRDSTFLWIESVIFSRGTNRNYRWEEWKDILLGIGSIEISNFIDWIEKNKINPSTSKLEALLIRFEIGCADWKSSYRPSHGYLTEKKSINEEHITSQANRILSSLPKIEEYARLSSRLRGFEKISWLDLFRAFLGIVSPITYGATNRDLHSIKFLDVGNTHFVQSKYRFIIGLRSGVFPRNPPSGLLLLENYRKKINEMYSKLYLRASDTDFENEFDFFEATIGNGQSKLFFSMPYLDERGHKEEWSIFVNTNSSIIYHLNASEIILPNSNLISPKSNWRKGSIRVRGKLLPSKIYEKYVFPEWIDIIKKEILPKIECFENNVLNNELVMQIEESKEKYLSKILSDIKNNPIPAHEIDLYGECPLVYYYYRFLYAFGSYSLGIEEGKRDYVPDWKMDFKLGPIPPVIRRKYISSKMEEVLESIIFNYNTVENIRKNINSINRKINSEKMEYYGKSCLINVMNFLTNKYENGQIQFKKKGVSSGDLNLFRPCYLKVNREMLHIARGGAKPRNRSYQNKVEAHTLHRRYGKYVLTPENSLSYSILDNNEYDRFIEDLRNFKYTQNREGLSICKDCIYNSLCGYWGFD